jgi:hypothetical protein
MPVTPPCGTMGVPVSFASLRMSETSCVDPGLQHDGRAPVIEIARLDEMRRHVGGIGECIFGTDNRGKAMFVTGLFMANL